MIKKLLRYKWLILVLMALAGWWWFGGSGGNKAASNTNAVHISAAAATRQDVPLSLALVGTVVAYETVAVKSRLDSQITNVLFHDGDDVKEGQVLFELDDRTLKAQIKQLEADTQKEKAQLVNAKLQYDRTLKLVKNNVVSQSQVDVARATYEGQAAQVSSVQASLDNARVMLTYTVIAAPISGRAGTIAVTRGNNVKTNDAALVTINQVRPIRVQFAVPQNYYETVKTAMAASEGLAVTALSGENQTTAEGKLEYIDNAIDLSTGTFSARAQFANPDEKLWPGMFVNVSLNLGDEKNVLSIPEVAVQHGQADDYVFAVAGDKVEQRPVKVARLMAGLAVISDGVKEGEQVVTDGLMSLKNGSSVVISAPEVKSDQDKAK